MASPVKVASTGAWGRPAANPWGKAPTTNTTAATAATTSASLPKKSLAEIQREQQAAEDARLAMQFHREQEALFMAAAQARIQQQQQQQRVQRRGGGPRQPVLHPRTRPAQPHILPELPGELSIVRRPHGRQPDVVWRADKGAAQAQRSFAGSIARHYEPAKLADRMPAAGQQSCYY
eukprot:m.56474 g.56474  ORF g.56474 m.56474 type:complete len:177 (+) comp13391_c3_seq1:134-664(+)